MIVLWLKTALDTRLVQLDYIAKENPGAALRLEQELIRQTNMLADYPLLGREGRVLQTRELIVTSSPFIAVYRVKNDRIEILRILHGAQKWPPVKKHYGVDNQA